MAEETTVVIGGGIIGLACAYELAMAGRRVHVVDRAPIGSGASTGNAGWVTLSQSVPVPSPGSVRDALRSAGRPESPVYVRPVWSGDLVRWLWRFRRYCTRAAFLSGAAALSALAERSFEVYDEWEKNGVATSLSSPGLVHAFLDEREAVRSLRTAAEVAEGRYAVPDAPLGPAEARQLEPALAEAVRAAYLIEDEGLVDPRVLVTSLRRQVESRGGTVQDRVEVTGLRVQGRQVRAVMAGRDELPCSTVVIAAGAWSGGLLAELGAPVLLEAGKGYSFSVALPTPPRHPILLADKHVAVSPLPDATRIAGTMEFSGNNLRLDWRRIEAIAKASRHYLGDWFGDPDQLMGLIGSPWVGGRPMLPDGLPLVDRVPGVGNAYVATGHGMLGVTLAPGTAAALNELMITGTRPPVLAPFGHRRP
jgi:glycine/D-amino acid oxidase-like deaminating enzyme